MLLSCSFFVELFFHLEVFVALGVPEQIHQIEVSSVVDRLAYFGDVVVMQPVHSGMAYSGHSPARMDCSRVQNVQIDLIIEM